MHHLLSLSTVLNSFALLSLFRVPLTNSTLLHRPTPGNEYERNQQTVLFHSGHVSLPHDNPTQSFWTHGTSDANPLAKEGSKGSLTLDADTVIIGSGITGVGAAYHLSLLVNQSGLSHNIVILEARDFCSGATGRNGGHLVPNAFNGFRTISDKYNVDEAVRSVLLERHTTDSILSILEYSGHEADVDLVGPGHIDLFFSDAEEVEAKAHWAAAENAGVDVGGIKFLSKNETEKKYGPSFPSVSIPGHNLWPLKLVTHLFRLAQHTLTTSNGISNVSLHTHTPVLSIKRLNTSSIRDAAVLPRRWLLETSRGIIHAHHVIHATNGYAAHLLPFLIATPNQEGIVPTRGQVIATPANVRTNKIGNLGFGANEGYEYWFPRPVYNPEDRPLIILGGGREVAGAGHELGITDDSVVNPVISQKLKDFLPTIYPYGWFKKHQEPNMEWTGIMGYTQSTNPFVGPVVDTSQGSVLEGQYIAAGYTGHGMPRAFGCAEVLARMIVSDLKNETWTAPEWFPDRFLTTSKWRL